MKLLVTGGTGFIGAPLCQSLLKQGHELLVLTRRPERSSSKPGLRFLSWSSEEWRRAIEDMDGVINLAGEPLVAQRWSVRQKLVIQESRLESTRTLIEALASAPRRPAVLINASAVGYYGPRGDEALAETDAPGSGFLAELCRAWEAHAQRAEPLGMRVVRLRIGVVLGSGGGALAKMVPPFRWWVGGPLGAGRQWVSWIHRDDVTGLIEWALTHPELSGAVNATAPSPVTMRTLCKELARALRRPCWAAVPGPALRVLLGEMAEVLLTGQQVLPQAALRSGYPFHYPELSQALRACLSPGERRREHVAHDLPSGLRGRASGGPQR